MIRFLALVTIATAVAQTIDWHSSDGLCTALEKASGKTLEHVPVTRRRVYDWMLFNSESDMLEIRLYTLARAVNYFIIVESEKSFTQRHKRMVFEDIQDRFALLRPHQIIHVVIESAALPQTENPWDIESFLRQEGLRRGLNASEHTRARDGDIVLVSDTDEILRPEMIHAMKHCVGWEAPNGAETRIKFKQQLYYYAYSWRHAVSMSWAGGDATVWNWSSPVYEIRGNPLGKATSIFIQDAGWHCSWCFRTLELFRLKVNSYSHTEHALPAFQTKHHIVNAVRYGRDLFNRSDQMYIYVDPVDVPYYVRAHADRFAYMLDRRGPTAGFVDFLER